MGVEQSGYARRWSRKDIDTVKGAAVELAGYILGMRSKGDLDGLFPGHLANIDAYLSTIARRRRR